MRVVVAMALALASTLVAGTVQALDVVDDAGRTVTLARPASRVVTLAPSLAELVFAAGGGDALVGTTALSDFPAAASRVPRIGDAGRLDVERVLSLKPDLVLVWQRGALGREIGQIGAAGIALFQIEPRRLDEVPRAIERLGALLGTESTAQRNAAEMRSTLDALRRRHAGAEPVRVFYQVWQRPLMTVGGVQLIDDVIALCGGVNVFAGLSQMAPVVSAESVVAANPEVIVTADETGGSAPAWRRAPDLPSLASWRRHPQLAAVRGNWLYTLNGDTISRQGPRVAVGAASMCALLDEVRRERRSR